MADNESFIEDFDFGISFADSSEVNVTDNQDAEISSLENKIEDVLSKIDTLSTGSDIDEYKELLDEQYKQKLNQVELMIIPLLNNLKKNPDKEYIFWPNRTSVIDGQIEKILTITRG
jgi:hypothetical protein|tara:strand:+ start:216 stop:566 length:351 start_codon:yes stop_codon:yes gene_type:complete